MNFNKLANVINESLTSEEVEGRNPNASFADWKAANPELAKGPSAYYHFKKSTRGGTTPAAAPIAPAVHHTEIDPRKQEIVDQLVSQGLSPEEIYKHLANTLPGQTPFEGNFKDVLGMIALAKGEEPSEVEPEFNPEAEKAAKMARLRSFFMKPKAERDRILAAKRKAAEVAPKVDKDEDGDEVEADPYVSHYVKAMKKSPYDADETDPVEAD